MVDAHGHVSGLGSALAIVDLTGASSYDEVIARVAAKARTLQPGVWVTGRGWDQNRWGDTRFPTHEKLTQAVPNNPVYLTRVDGHAGLANKKAMEAAGLSATTRDPFTNTTSISLLTGFVIRSAPSRSGSATSIWE